MREANIFEEFGGASAALDLRDARFRLWHIHVLGRREHGQEKEALKDKADTTESQIAASDIW